jgi:hypothetical protein
MNRLSFAAAGLLGIALLAGTGAKPEAPVAHEPVLLELFTSQGCSSCPPADRLAQKLSRERDLVVVSRPVTYWDRLGWKDTLALEANTRQQRAYAARGLGGNSGVYTPQIVIAGRYGEVGSDEAAIRNRAAQAASGHAIALRTRPADNGGHAVGIGGTTDRPAELVLWAVDRTAAVAIARGENGGRTVHYTNVLKRESKLADWNGGKASVLIAPDQLAVSGADRYAVVLRVPGGGPVLAARWVEN